jgi:nitronate monooxygenase
MLAGIDYVIMGAGIPLQMPGIITQLVTHNDSNYRVDCVDARPEDDLKLHFKISELFPNFKEKLELLKRPKFFPIISSNVLALALIKRGTGKIDGFIVETPVAGGHNAPPRKEQYNEKNEPVYGAKDVVDLEKLAKLGLPFWLAGGYGNQDGLQKALSSGAQGIQVGTAFAYANESGMRSDIKNNVLKRATEGNIELITSARCSPSGFPFKVVQLENSSSDEKTYNARKRICDKGHLRHAYRKPDGTIGLRCPAESVDIYIKKGGKLEDTVGRRCLCNALISTVGFPQIRKDGYKEDYIVTSGDDVVNLKLFQKEGKLNYSAKDVLDVLKSKTKTTT